MPTTAAIELSFLADDVALLTFDLPDKGANILTQAVLGELASHLDELEKRKDLVGLIITSAKSNIFIAGADVTEFAASLDYPQEKTQEMSQAGQKLFQRLSRGPWVSVAAIHGTCLGGGAELAVWCDRRIVSDNERTEIGFPEVKLGIFPGWGGTVRLPRLVGLSNAVEMITSGNSVGPREAYAMGLADDITSPEDLVDAAVRLIRQEAESGAYLQDRKLREEAVEINETEYGFLGATASAYIQQQTKGQYPAPGMALETLLGGAILSAQEALGLEAIGLSELFGSPVSSALINVFLLTDRNKKDRGVDQSKPEVQEINRVSVIGAGIMGAGIAAANIKRGIHVKLNDARDEALESGIKEILDEVSFDKATKSKQVQRAIDHAALLIGTRSQAEIADVDLVIEAVVENTELKKKIFAGLESHLGETTLLASNTSTLPITTLAADLKHPERFVGIHFFNPVRKMKLVEIIRGEKTNDETVASAVAYAKRLGKFPVVVGDGPGFLVNRLLFPYMNEAVVLLQEGVPLEQIDKAAKKFGMPMGPIALYDMVGIDTSFYAGRTMYDAFPERTLVSPILPRLIKAGRLGQKSGQGFYAYPKKNDRGQLDPELEPLISGYIEKSDEKLSTEQIQHRLMLPMLLEATRVMESGQVRSPRDIDLGMIFGIGFPPFLGGLMYWADTVGADNLLKMLEPFAGLGPRYQPTELLKSVAESKSKFYDLAD